MAPRDAVRVVGVDTSLRSTGVGVVEARGSAWSVVEYGCIRNPAPRSLSASLCFLLEQMEGLLERTRPDVAAIEGAFFCRNARTAMVLGQARGVVVAACARRGIPVYEYAPRLVKQALTGFGGAGKGQVGQMIRTMLGLREAPPEDAADALAIAVTHLQSESKRTLGLLRPL